MAQMSGIGSFGKQGLRLRDQISGQRYTGIYDSSSLGWSFMAGGDLTYVYYRDHSFFELRLPTA